MTDIRPIRTDDDYQAALGEIERLFGAKPGTNDADRLEVLATLIAAYEAQRHGPTAPDPIEVLRLTMEGQGRSQSDLAALLGSRSRASEVLSRRRALSPDMIERISRTWSIPQAALAAPYAVAGGFRRLLARTALAGVAGLAVSAAALGATFWYYGRDLPDVAQISTYRPPTEVRIDDAGRVAGTRRFVPLSEIPPHVMKAFLAAEDQNFYTHAGTSLRAILRALVQNLASLSDAPAGASTITQQVAKNVLLAGEPRSVERKVKEMILARRIEDRLSKNQILELYLNQIYFGGSAYGIGVAARTYFGKPVSDLTVAEAAALAALPKGPNLYRMDLAENHERAKGRRDWVLGRMAEDGLITSSAAHLAKAEPLVQTN